MLPGLQPHATRPAAPCYPACSPKHPACNPTLPGLQPHATRPAAPCYPACSPMLPRLQPHATRPAAPCTPPAAPCTPHAAPCTPPACAALKRRCTLPHVVGLPHFSHALCRSTPRDASTNTLATSGVSLRPIVDQLCKPPVSGFCAEHEALPAEAFRHATHLSRRTEAGLPPGLLRACLSHRTRALLVRSLGFCAMLRNSAQNCCMLRGLPCTHRVAAYAGEQWDGAAPRGPSNPTICASGRLQLRASSAIASGNEPNWGLSRKGLRE